MTQDPSASASAPDQPAPDQVAEDQPAQAGPDQVAQTGPEQPAPDLPAQDQPPPQSPPESGPDQAAGQPPAAASARRRIALLVSVGAVAAVAILVVGGLVIASILGGGDPEAGDCMNDSALASEMEVVDCDSGEAVWSVIGVDTGWTFGDFEAAPLAEVCQDHPGAVQALWITDSSDVSDGTDGDVVCLRAIEPAPAGG